MCLLCALQWPWHAPMYYYILFDFNNQVVVQLHSCSIINRWPDTFIEHSVDSHRCSYVSMSVSEMTALAKQTEREKMAMRTTPERHCVLLFALQIWSFFCKWHIRSITFVLSPLHTPMCVHGMCSLSHSAICLAFASCIFFFWCAVCSVHCIVCPFAVHRALYCYAITFMFAHAIYFVTTAIDSCLCARCTHGMHYYRLHVACLCAPKAFSSDILPYEATNLYWCPCWRHCRLPQASPMGAIYEAAVHDQTNVGFLFWRQQSAILLPRSSWHERCSWYVCSFAPTTVWSIPWEKYLRRQSQFMWATLNLNNFLWNIGLNHWFVDELITFWKIVN